MNITVVRTKKFKPEYFSENELAELGKLADDRKMDWQSSRLAVKKAVRGYFWNREEKKFRLDEIEIISRKFSRPTFKIKGKKIRNIGISLSHSYGTGAGAVSEGKFVGVDIEKKKFSAEFKKGFLAKEELRLLKKLKPAHNDWPATLFWCVKEAYLKAIGRGLKKHPRELKIQLKNGNIRHVSIQDKGVMTNAKVFWSIKNEHCIAVVTI